MPAEPHKFYGVVEYNDDDNIYAVGDRSLKYYGNNVYYKKLFILRKYLKDYNKVCLIDDSKKIGKLIYKYNYTGITINNIGFINV